MQQARGGIMDHAATLRSEDPSKLGRESHPELAPASASEAHLPQQQRQQTQAQQCSSMETGVSRIQKLPRDSDGEDGAGASKQNTGRPLSRGPGIRGLSGPRATLYALAFSPWGGAKEDRSSSGQHGEEGRGSPRLRRSGGIGQRSCGGGVSRRPRPALALTRDMCSTYSTRNPLFRFTPNVPRRVLTVPSEPAGNNGQDNVEFNLIARVNDVLEAPGTTHYSVLDLLGQGTFGQVFRCQDHSTKNIVAIKVVKNKPAYRNQALLEIQVAKLLNERFDPNDTRNIVRLLDCFEHQNHLCLVFELLSINLYELLKQNQFRGLPLSLIRHFIKQILEALGALEQANVIHCDLKPENVLLMNKTSEGEDGGRGCRGGAVGGGNGGVQSGHPNRLKVIDFGSACYEGQTMYSYIQSRFYRSPEVLLGLPYDGAIDIWSLGCISVEMFLGLPIFPGVSDHNQICRIVEKTGSLPEFMLENGKDTLKFFKRVSVPVSEGADGEVGARRWRTGADMAVSPDRDVEDTGRERTSSRNRARGDRGRGYRYVLKTPEEYARDTNTSVPQLKKYFKHTNIPDIIQSYPLPGAHRRGAGSGNTPDAAQEKEARKVFTHFVIGLLNPNPWKRWTPKQAASHPFITGQPHPRDLGALTIVADPLIEKRFSNQMQRQLQQQKDQQEAERKHAQRLRHHQQQRQHQEQQKREQGRGMAIPGASSQPRGLPSLSGVSLTGSGTPGSMGSHSQYHASPLHHVRRSSGDNGLVAMQIAHTPQGQRGGGDDHRLGSMSHPIDVPAGDGTGDIGGHAMFRGDLERVSGIGGGHDLMARSMGYAGRGGAGTSYPPLGGDDSELDTEHTEAYSYSAASFSMGGASGNYAASDFGYALQRPGLRYEPASYKQSPPAAHSSSRAASGAMHLRRRGGSGIIPSFAGYQHHQAEGPRGHERGGRALSMDQTQTAALQYYLGTGGGNVGGQLPGGGGRFGMQSVHYANTIQQSTSVSAATAGPPGYTPLARGGFLAPPSAFRSDAPQASVPWVRAGRGIGHSQPLSEGPRAHSTSPLYGRPLAMDFPPPDQPELAHEPDDMQTHDSAGGSGAATGGESWRHRVPGVESEELAGGTRQARHPTQRGHRREHRRSLGTDPDTGNEGVPFSFQLDDGRLPAGGGSGNSAMMGGSHLGSPLGWLGGGGAAGGGGAGGVDDPEGVHKRSLNGTSKGVSPAAGSVAGTSSPHDEGDLIRRVSCEEPPGVLQQQAPQSGSLLSQQLMQYQQMQGPGHQRSRTPFGSAAPGVAPDLSPSPVPHQQFSESPYSMAGAGQHASGERWIAGRGGGQQASLDDSASDQGAGRGVGGSTWVTSSNTRTLRRRASPGSSEFYFVDTQQQGGAGAPYVPPMSPAGAGTTRSLYSGRGHTTHGGTPSSFGAVTQHAQAQGPGQQQSPMPPRPPRPGDNSGMGMDKGSWAGSGGDSSSWGSRTSPMQPMQQHLPTPPRSMGGRGAGSWDDRGGPEIMRSIHEGNPSPDAST